MNFNEYRYLYPPRPDKKIAPPMLSFQEKRGWVAQVKKNGTCTVLYVTPEKEIITKTRHDSDHKMWKDTESKAVEYFKTLPGNGWYVFACELMHNKTKHIQDTLYVFDIMVADGESLTGMTFAERQEIIMKLFGVDENTEVNDTHSHYVINPRVWVAKLIHGDFKKEMAIIQERSEHLTDDMSLEDEGLVLKNPKASLNFCSQKGNSSWMVKCRVGHKNYTF